LEKRRAALSGKVAVIKVGGATETEIEEKKFRVDDAVHAVKAALDEGIVPGGGRTLINLSLHIAGKNIKAKDVEIAKMLAENNLITGSAGADLLIKALNQPFILLMNNAGLNPAGYIKDIAKEEKLGVDVNTGEVVNLLEAGIIDPTRITREAIQNAVSIAGTSMTMGALIVDVPEKESPAAGAPGMGGMGGMM
jgi:chaperonin GroEL